jgi:ribose transport system substrate-binding protein
MKKASPSSVLARFLLAFTLAAETPEAQSALYGFAGKSTDDKNFIVAFQAFENEARKNGDSSIHIGSPGPANFRNQDSAIASAIGQGIKGLAISVTFSDFLARSSLRSVPQTQLPVVSFDSDFSKPHQSLRKAYVGIDNLEFGMSFAALIRKHKPNGGRIWLMSADSHDPNLDERIQGVRIALSGNPDYPRGKRLMGEGGWREDERSPWYCGDENSRALEQLRITLQSGSDVFLSVGEWPITKLPEYLKAIAPFRKDIAAKSKLVLIGTGTPSRGLLDALDNRQISGIVSIDFSEMGRQTYLTLKKIEKGKPVQNKTLVKSTIRESP